MTHPRPLAPALALAVLLLAAAPAAAQDKPAPPARTGGVGELLRDGGVVGGIIILLSVVATGFAIEHAITIRRQRLIPPEAVAELERLIKARKVEDAVRFCETRERPSLFTNVVLAGLLRFRASEYGFAEYRAAVEEAGEEQTSRLYRKTEALAIIGAVAPMLGLLGTVQGMIEAFNTIAATGGAAKPADLASSISKALVTTLEGLVVAIPALTVLSFFRTRIDSLVAEAGSKVEQVLMPLSRPK